MALLNLRGALNNFESALLICFWSVYSISPLLPGNAAHNLLLKNTVECSVIASLYGSYGFVKICSLTLAKYTDNL